MKESTLRKIPVVASFALLISLPAISAASYQGYDIDQGKITVSYSDLDVSSDAGAQALYSRMQAVSEKACDTDGYRIKGSVKALQAANSCYDELLGKLVSKLGNDKVTAIHES